jgi:hypothetical protein
MVGRSWGPRRLTYELDVKWIGVDRGVALPIGEWRDDGTVVTLRTDTTDGQVVQARVLANVLRPNPDDRGSLTVHVGVDPVELDFGQHLLRFVDRWQDAVFRQVTDDPTRHYRLPPDRVAVALEAEKLDEFYAALAPSDRDGSATPLRGIDLTSLQRRGTIEFGHWRPSVDPAEIHDALLWCQRFVHHTLYDTDPTETYRQALKRPWRFPMLDAYR